MPLALILIDALSLSYLRENTLPIINTLTKDGYIGPLENMYAYRGIEATLFSGYSPAEHGVWGEYQLSPKISSTSLNMEHVQKLVISIGDLIPLDRLRLDIRYVVDRFWNRGGLCATGNLIPSTMLNFFTKCLRKPIWEPKSLGHKKTIFDDLREYGMQFRVVLNPMIQFDNQIESHIRQKIAQGILPDFWYIKYSALDSLGHRFGPSVSRLGPALNKLNTQLESLIKTLKSAYVHRGIDIIILADHGMSKVNQTFDARPLIQKIKALPGRDYLYFLDSTTIRFWSRNTDLLEEIKAGIFAIPGLRVLNTKDFHELMIPANNSTGNLIIALEEGKTVFPDYFHRSKSPLGMHGYAKLLSEAGMPVLGVEPGLVKYLPSRRPLRHADVWTAIHSYFGFSEI